MQQDLRITDLNLWQLWAEISIYILHIGLLKSCSYQDRQIWMGFWSIYCLLQEWENRLMCMCKEMGCPPHAEFGSVSCQLTFFSDLPENHWKHENLPSWTNMHLTCLWLIPLMMLVGDHRGNWAVRMTLRRNWFGFCTSGWVDVSVWLRVYSWSQATRRIWNNSIITTYTVQCMLLKDIWLICLEVCNINQTLESFNRLWDLQNMAFCLPPYSPIHLQRLTAPWVGHLA